MPSFLPEVYALVRVGAVDEAMDVVLLHVDDLLTAHDFASCDRVLRDVDVEQLDVSVIIAVLSSTRRAALYLRERPAFVQRARTRLTQLAPDRVDSLLKGLTPEPRCAS